MLSPYHQDAARLRAEILSRVEAGETVRAVCASPDLPNEWTVRKWARADAAFREALTVARRRGTERRLYAFDEGKAAAFLARARAGEPVHSLIGQPGMPSRYVYRRWKMTEAPFAEAVFALQQRRLAHFILQAKVRRDFDQALADRIIVALNKGFHTGVGLQAVLDADPELPCSRTLKRWRREQPLFDKALRAMISARRRAVKPVPEAMVEAVVAHIVEGGSFASFGRLPGRPTPQTLGRWLRDPNFAAAMAQACDWREDWYHDQIEEILERTPPGPLREMKRAVAPLRQQLARLRHRPGATHRKRTAGGGAMDPRPTNGRD